MNATRGKTIGTAEAIGELFDIGLRLGTNLLDSLQSARTSSVGEALQRMVPRISTAPRWGCEIPPPCWLPRQLGDVRSAVCPGGTASVRIRVENCSATGCEIRFELTGADGATISPSTLSVGPMEHGLAVATMTVDPASGHGTEREVLIWIRGCNVHVLRWKVRVAKRASDSCHEVVVEDCPDLIHHWYDHFYCERGCHAPR